MAEHIVTISDGRYVCTRCGAKLLTRMQFNSVECRDRTSRPVSAEFRLSDEQRALRALWREAAEKPIDAGIDWHGIVRQMGRDFDHAEAGERAVVERIEAWHETSRGTPHQEFMWKVLSDIRRLDATRPDTEAIR